MAAYSDEELLKIVGAEHRRSVGFELDEVLLAERNQALRFIKGDMAKEVPSLPNRSKAVSTDIQDAINTLLPDLIEVFIGDGDDALAFVPRSQEDEEAAEQETDYVSYVVFQENDGFLLLYTMFSDALSQKTGIAKYWWESEGVKQEKLEGQTVEALHMAVQDGQASLIALEQVEPEEGDDEPRFNATLERKATGKVCTKAVAPEDFTVSVDTIRLADSPYCAHRTRERAQDLIARGIPRDIVAKLPSYTTSSNETDQARDTAGEYTQSRGDASNDDMKTVEIIEHYVRLLDGKELKLYRVQTNRDETVLIDREEVDRIPFAALTPYIVTHRFYGQSVADLLTEIQKINTVLTRTALDSAYFALNQRMEVASSGSNEFTIPDLLRNEPGVPVRSTSGQAVRPIGAGTLSFDPFQALEFFATKGEQRTGIVRNAQGLNPDTLHDTAKGAAALMAAAQKRVRMIARVFAETGIKDLYLGIHALIRENAEEHRAGVVRLRNGWTEIDPSSWNERADMKIEVGIGSGGREAALIALNQQGEFIREVIGAQGGMNGPLITAENVYNYGKQLFSKTGSKTPELFLSDPKDFKAPEPKPDPEMLKIQAQTAMDQAKLQGQQQLEQSRIAADQQKAANDLMIEQRKLELEHQFKTEDAQRQLEFQREQATAELQLKQQEMALEAQVKVQTAHITSQAPASDSVNGPQFGGEPG